MAGEYWERRRDHAYYRTAVEFVRRFAPTGRLLDVGGGIGAGCRYLEWLPDHDRTCVETNSGPCRLDGVRLIVADFRTWEPDGPYDVLMCLQVLEHIQDAAAFARKLLSLAPVAVISVPYLWDAGTCKTHVHDPVDEVKLRKWTGRDPVESVIVSRRLVCVYEGGDDVRAV